LKFHAALARSSDVHAVLAHCLARCNPQINFPQGRVAAVRR